MIKASILKNNKGNIYEFEVKGHAGYAESGYDIICSAVTTLVFNTINSIEEFTDDVIKYDIASDGYIKVIIPSLKYENIASKETIVLLNSMLFGLQNIEDEYKNDNYLLVSIKEV